MKISPSVREWLYGTFEAIGVVIGAVEAGCLAAGKHPLPLQITVAVYAFLSARTHGIARARVTKPLPTDSATDVDTDTATG